MNKTNSKSNSAYEKINALKPICEVHWSKNKNTERINCRGSVFRQNCKIKSVADL